MQLDVVAVPCHLWTVGDSFRAPVVTHITKKKIPHRLLCPVSLSSSAFVTFDLAVVNPVGVYGSTCYRPDRLSSYQPAPLTDYNSQCANNLGLVGLLLRRTDRFFPGSVTKTIPSSNCAYVWPIARFSHRRRSWGNSGDQPRICKSGG